LHVAPDGWLCISTPRRPRHTTSRAGNYIIVS
jgi:hypothetical protein